MISRFIKWVRDIWNWLSGYYPPKETKNTITIISNGMDQECEVIGSRGIHLILKDGERGQKIINQYAAKDPKEFWRHWDRYNEKRPEWEDGSDFEGI